LIAWRWPMRAPARRRPAVDAYCADFPAFIAGFPGTEALPYLAGLASFDWQLDEWAGSARAAWPARIGWHADAACCSRGGARLHFAASCACMSALPVDELREAYSRRTRRPASSAPERGAHYALWARSGV